MSPNPIARVLSTFRREKVRALLMGGQACILYGAAEFTRDVDLAIAVSPANLARVRAALAALRAEPVYFPPLSAPALRRGHACHFRCRAPGLQGLRIDLMSRMRGADPFPRLWARRVTLDLPGVGPVAVISLRDLVRIKKTQRDKDWPMVRRLVEADVDGAPAKPPPDRILWWLREARTADLLAELAERFPAAARRAARGRPALRAVLRGNAAAAERALRIEEDRERARDRRYWAPLRRELERWRQARGDREPSPPPRRPGTAAVGAADAPSRRD